MSTVSRLVLRILSYLFVAASLHAQTPVDTARSIAGIDRDLAAHEAILEREVWPGYRFTELGVMYVLPGRAKIAAHWPGEAPPGMRPLDGFPGIVWSDTSTVRWEAGLPVATLVVSPSMSRSAVAGLALHEAFHAFESRQRREGRRFGAGENSMLTSRYPIFDVVNEAQLSVEAKLLRDAVLAASNGAARQLAQQFLAVREQRQARLDTALVNYEKAAELHEGMAQYVLLRGLAVLAQHDPAYAAAAAEEKKMEGDLLANTLSQTNLSPRRRAYASGSYLGLLLDRLGVDWKQRVMSEDEWIQDVLAWVVGRAAITPATKARITAATESAVESVNALRTARAIQRDSLLSSRGLLIALDPTVIGRFDWCGFDPQNLLATGSGELMHTRMLHLCSRGQKVAEIYQPVVEQNGRIQTAVDPQQLRFSVNGQTIPLPAAGTTATVENVILHTDDLEIRFSRAQLIRGKATVLLVPLTSD